MLQVLNYRKKPNVVAAVLTGDVMRAFQAEPEALPHWILERIQTGSMKLYPLTMSVLTNHGYAEAQPGDWLILTGAGEVYPCSDAEFRKNYELAEPAVEG